MRYTFLWISLIVLFNIACSNRQQKNTSESDNQAIRTSISNQKVTAIAEDASGYIWLGTFRGLNRFNGYDFHQYFNTEDSTSIADNQVQAIYKDSKKRLWVATVNGMSLYNEKGVFDNMPHEGRSRNISLILENKEGIIFANTGLQLCVYDPGSRRFKVAINNFLDSEHYMINCHIDKADRIWAIAPYQVRSFNSTTLKQVSFIKSATPIHYSFLRDNGELWLAALNTLSILHTNNGKFIPIPPAISEHPVLSKATITLIHPYDNVSLLINTQKDGLFLYNYSTGKVIGQNESGFPFDAPAFEIKSMFTDSKKNLWIGSTDQGFTVRYNYKKRFNNNNFLCTRFENQSVTSVCPDKDKNLWIVTHLNGLFVYNLENKNIHPINTTPFFAEDKFYRDCIKYVFVDAENNIWLVANNKLLKCRYDGKIFQRVESFPFPNILLNIAQDHNGTIWVGGGEGYVSILARGEKAFKKIQLYPKGFNFTSRILTLSSGDILVSSFNQNLCLINADDLSVKEIEIKKYMKRSVFIPIDLYEDSEGYIWIGTLTNGLFRYSPKSNKMESMTGLPCNDMSSIMEDAEGNMWIGTLFGLFKFDRSIQHFISYDASDGIGGNQFNERSVSILHDHTLIFGGTHGLTLFNPLDIDFKRQIPLVFEDMKIHNRLVRPSSKQCIDKELLYGPKIHLKYNENSFSISYSALDYGEYPRVRYFYKLNGFNKQWVDAHNDRSAYYSNLMPGNYTFLLKITNNDNTAVETETSIPVSVSAPPWLSWPALSIYGVMIIALVWFINHLYFRINLNKTRALMAIAEKEQEHRVNQMNMSFFANISHEFRTPLTMIAGPVASLCNDKTIGGENKSLLLTIQRSVNRMLRLINQLMDFNKLENGMLNLNVKQADIILQMNQLIDTFKVNAKEKGITLNAFGMEDPYYMWLDADKLEKILANLLSNALKFTSQGGKIYVKFDVISHVEASLLFPLTGKDVDTEYVKITVGDNGRGIPEDKLEKIFERYYQIQNQTKEFYNWGTGIGLYYSRQLAELHHGYIKAQKQQEGSGTLMSFILPVNKLSYSEEERCTEGEKDVYYTHEFVENLPVATDDKTEAQQPTLLLIEDDTEVTYYLKTLLSSTYKVVVKYDADSAYKSIEEVSPDLILSDVIMPGTDGFQFCRMVKENISYTHIPVILLTAKATIENQVEGLNTGANAYVTKPFDPLYLMALIKSQLLNREKTRSILSSSTQTEKIDKNVLSPQDNAFMSSLYKLMESELSNPELNITRLTEALKISRTKFYYKVKGLTGENPNVFFKTYKLNRAAELILEGKYNTSEIADMTGFSTLSHFSACFKKQFGVSPSRYKP
jgi:signal transduction histidine kinase/ligand-binding sensor domain-containing protein/DNA-binding response OmpR family regulator